MVCRVASQRHTFFMIPDVDMLSVVPAFSHRLRRLSIGCIFIFITEASPNPQSLGATNGLSQTVASIVRTIGPTLSTSLFAVSIERNLFGGNVVYILMIALSLASIWLAGRLPDEVSLRSKEDWNRSVEDAD